MSWRQRKPGTSAIGWRHRSGSGGAEGAAYSSVRWRFVDRSRLQRSDINYAYNPGLPFPTSKSARRGPVRPRLVYRRAFSALFRGSSPWTLATRRSLMRLDDAIDAMFCHGVHGVFFLPNRRRLRGVECARRTCVCRKILHRRVRPRWSRRSRRRSRVLLQISKPPPMRQERSRTPRRPQWPGVFLVEDLRVDAVPATGNCS